MPRFSKAISAWSPAELPFEIAHRTHEPQLGRAGRPSAALGECIDGPGITTALPHRHRRQKRDAVLVNTIEAPRLDNITALPPTSTSCALEW